MAAETPAEQLARLTAASVICLATGEPFGTYPEAELADLVAHEATDAAVRAADRCPTFANRDACMDAANREVEVRNRLIDTALAHKARARLDRPAR